MWRSRNDHVFLSVDKEAKMVQALGDFPVGWDFSLFLISCLFFTMSWTRYNCVYWKENTLVIWVCLETLSQCAVRVWSESSRWRSEPRLQLVFISFQCKKCEYALAFTRMKIFREFRINVVTLKDPVPMLRSYKSFDSSENKAPKSWSLSPVLSLYSNVGPPAFWRHTFINEPENKSLFYFETITTAATGHHYLFLTGCPFVNEDH